MKRERRLLSLGLSLAVTAAAIVTAVAGTSTPAQAEPVTITNGTQFRDTSGNLLQAHGGGVLKVGSYYYWFGENRNADNTFRAVSVYRSTNLRDWEFRNNVLTQSSASELQVANIERPKVIYNASTGRYVMWMHKENGSNYSEARAAVASSATVDGNYTYHGSFRPLGQHMSRDITLYNDNGTAYMISAADENYDLHIYRLTADYLNVATLVGNFWNDAHREAPAMFKRGSTYFLLTSAATGWNPNQAKYATASSISGPWTGWTNVGDSTTFRSQPTFVLPIQGSSTTSYLYMGDRWAGAWSGPVNDSQYVWLPITFPSSTSMRLDWYPSITIDASTGTITGQSPPYYRITARHSGKVMDVVSSSTANSAEVKQYGWNGGGNQKWEFQDAGSGYFRIVNQNSGKCLDVASASTADSANIVQYTCGNGTNQQWQWVATGSYYQLRARHSGKCLDVVSSGTTDGTDITQYTCGSGTNQQWTRTQS
ncbi:MULTISPECIES: RICIN domain-containing protein [unclassified Plantactinospora]|uniref:RICIN domain-containing protein n=1 Tax=Plantactinospora sp. BB1 TaxID=2071627 RepID=UPI000D1549C6|nr:MULTISPECIES: RICIN domain-containing protein [unclassified Plantactinospora]AVT29165.1 beta-xylosidase [Plantactinospora sp. BC1]AVT35570.1 beta-xylosidase [Plantactinospora sp. BB1]